MIRFLSSSPSNTSDEILIGLNVNNGIKRCHLMSITADCLIGCQFHAITIYPPVQIKLDFDNSSSFSPKSLYRRNAISDEYFAYGVSMFFFPFKTFLGISPIYTISPHVASSSNRNRVKIKHKHKIVRASLLFKFRTSQRQRRIRLAVRVCKLFLASELISHSVDRKLVQWNYAVFLCL